MQWTPATRSSLALARGEITAIGATTLDEYRHIEKDGALERRFQPVTVDPSSVEDTIEILRGRKKSLEDHHAITISDEAVVSAAQMADRYITDRFLPDKAIDVIDEAGSALAIDFPGTELTAEHINSKISQMTGIKLDKLTPTSPLVCRRWRTASTSASSVSISRSRLCPGRCVVRAPD